MENLKYVLAVIFFATTIINHIVIIFFYNKEDDKFLTYTTKILSILGLISLTIIVIST